MRKLLATSVLILWLASGALAQVPATPPAKTRIPAPEELLRSLAEKKHPYLLFHTIQETPGWKYKDRQPWQEWLRLSVDPGRWKPEIAVETLGMASNGMYSEERSGEQAMLWAFAHLLTGKPDSLEVAVDFLKRAQQLAGSRASKGGDGRVLGRLLIGFGLAYDWVQPQLTPADDHAIREQLAALADAVCQAYSTWSNAHDRIIADSGLGIIALALADYAGSSATKPVDWLRHATTYLFVNDRFNWEAGLHFDAQKATRSALEGTLNPGGFNQLGSYSIYWMPQFAVWLSVYHRALGRNPLDDFPIARRALDVPLWTSMPNRMDSQQGTREHQYYHWYKAILPLLTPEERGGFHWYADNTPADPLRERRTYATLGAILFFILDDDALPYKAPAWTSFVSPAAESAVLRSGWNWDADWLFLKVMSYPGPSDRHMLHNDNLSFELYSRGNYLLSDGGEVKYRMRGYGPQYASGHNTLLVDGVGPVKEDITRQRFEFVDPARLTNFALMPGLEFADAEMQLTHVEYEPTWADYEDRGRRNAKPLHSPVTWRRTVLFPGKNYFLLIDNVQGRTKHDYEFLFHFSSLDIVPTQGEEPGKVVPGKVVGELRINDQTVDWDSAVKTDPLTATRPRRELGSYAGASQVLWRTLNPWGKPVELRLVSSADADASTLGRTWGRVAQMRIPPPFTGGGMEVDHPFLSFRNSANGVTRIVALLTRYADGEDERKASRLPVTGRGSALRLEAGDVTDVVATGKGPIKAAKLTTDAEIAFIRRKSGKVQTALMIRGKELRYDRGTLLSAPQVVPQAAFEFSDREILGHVHLDKPTTIAIRVSIMPKSVSYRPEAEDPLLVRPDQAEVASPLSFRKEGGLLTVQVPAGAGQIVIR